MKNRIKAVLGAVILGSISMPVYAQSINEESALPTVVYGSAATASGDENIAIVEQPENAANPLGDPLVIPSDGENKTPPLQPVENKKTTPDKTMSNDLGSDFQNTLLEANGMVYDVQAYPLKDMGAIGNSANPKTIYSPNVNH